MFERCTDNAKRVVFFARYEASKYGHQTVDDLHLLLGLLRENKKGIEAILATQGVGRSAVAELRRKAEQAAGPFKQGVSTSVDLPLSDAGKRIFAYAAEEADFLRDQHIGPEHLLLGILREGECAAAAILRGAGIELTEARREIASQE